MANGTGRAEIKETMERSKGKQAYLIYTEVFSAKYAGEDAHLKAWLDGSEAPPVVE